MRSKTFYFLLLIVLTMSVSLRADEAYMYRLILKDKGNSQFTINHPEEFLSEKSLERRKKQGITIDDTDLPIDTAYISGIRKTGAEIMAISKWVNSVTVYVSDSLILENISNLTFVDTLYKVWRGNPLNSENKFKKASVLKVQDNDVNIYGKSFSQISMLNGQLLHESGFRGRGMTIAVLDGGFSNCDQIDAFDFSKVLEVKNFTHLKLDPLRLNSDHGTKVLSCMLSNKPGTYVGTAPEANYYLFLTEIVTEEYPVEEDYWVSAMEYADSIGVDVATTSLGYSSFDDSTMNHTWDQLDGNAVLMSRAAGMAADKGILLLCAAGNEGSKVWRKISIPSDAKNVITVGSVNEDMKRSSFSSQGLSADHRIKPDQMAMGSSPAIINQFGAVVYADGTSYATPILAGLAACLWQALPELTNKEIMAEIRRSSDRYNVPDSLYGYGIPDIYQAYKQNSTGISAIKESKLLIVDSRENKLYINLPSDECVGCHLLIFNSLGRLVIEYPKLSQSIDISPLFRGVYIAYLQSGKNQYIRKFIKF